MSPRRSFTSALRHPRAIALFAALGSALALGLYAFSSRGDAQPQPDIPDAEQAAAIHSALTESERRTEHPPLPSLGELPSPGALQFAPGTDYASALRQIFMAENSASYPIAGAKLVAPLPNGKVLSGTPREGVTVDLGAPFGYLPADGGQLQTALLHYWVGATDAQIERAEAGEARPDRPWPVGAYVAVPTLPECMVMKDASDVTAECDGAGPVFEGRAIGDPLP